MILKIFLVLFVLVRLEYIRSNESIYYSRLLTPVRNEIFDAMTSVTQKEWNQTASNGQNFHIFPVIMKMRDYCNLTKSYYEHHSKGNFTPDKFLEKPHFFGNTLASVLDDAIIEMSIPNIVLYDDTKNVSQPYLNDLRKLYRTEEMGIIFTPGNDVMVTWDINRLYDYTVHGYHPKKVRLNLTGMTSYHAMLLAFQGCWDKPTTFMRRENTNRRRRSIPPAPGSVFPTLDLDTLELLAAHQVDTFSGKDSISYYNNADKKYEAIQIPFEFFDDKENQEIAMIVMKPYNNHSLEIFRPFTGADYKQLFHVMNKYESYKKVHFTIPIIKTNKFYIGDEGVAMNLRRVGNCKLRKKFKDEANVHYKLFSVDRPFAVIIYHVRTQFVFMYALIRNITSQTSYQGYQNRIHNVINVEEEF